MKTKNEIVELLRKDKGFIQKNFGVGSIALFGSYARNEQSEESNIDFLVKLKEPKAALLFGVITYLKSKFGKNADVIRDGPHLSQRFFSVVKKDLVYA